MTNIVSIIPVGAAEPLPVIENSVACLQQLAVPDTVDHRCLYVVETPEDADDERVAVLREADVDVLTCPPDTGRRAGTINIGLEAADDADYIALFDIDSRPTSSFLEQAIDAAQTSGAFLVSGSRDILNADQNLVTRMVAAEFDILNTAQAVLNQGDGFCHYNGLIGLLDAEYLRRELLATDVLCADFDFSSTAYKSGLRAEHVPAITIGEQAATTVPDLFRQKIRWMTGAAEGVRDHAASILTGETSWRVRATWLATVTFPFFSALLTPFTPLYGAKSLWDGNSFGETVKRVVALFLFGWIVTAAGLIAAARVATGNPPSWETPQREAL